MGKSRSRILGKNKTIYNLIIILIDGQIDWDDNIKSFLDKERNTLPGM